MGIRLRRLAVLSVGYFLPAFAISGQSLIDYPLGNAKEGAAVVGAVDIFAGHGAAQGIAPGLAFGSVVVPERGTCHAY